MSSGATIRLGNNQAPQESVRVSIWNCDLGYPVDVMAPLDMDVFTSIEVLPDAWGNLKSIMSLAPPSDSQHESISILWSVDSEPARAGAAGTSRPTRQ